MKITFVGHASLLVETNDITILSDPWWQGPCFGAQWWVHPEPCRSLVEQSTIDFIYISHGHADHLHHGTLSRLPKSAVVLVAEDLDLNDAIEGLGFKCVALPSGAKTEIAPHVHVEIRPTHGGDSLMVVDDGKEVCLNLNDSLHSAPAYAQDEAIAALRGRYQKIDYLFCAYGTASHFPNCYRIPGKNDAETARRRQSYFNRAWASIVCRLEPTMAFPFAANVVFLDEKLQWANEPVHNDQRPVDVFDSAYPESPTTVFDIAPGFAVNDGRIISEVFFKPLSMSDLKRERPKDFQSANSVSVPSNDDIAGLAEIIRHNAIVSTGFLREYDSDYVFLVELERAAVGIEIAKSGNQIDVRIVPSSIGGRKYDIVFTTRLSYLRRALTTRYGSEVIFVGSGGIFTYQNRAAADANLHSELSVLLQYVTAAPSSRFGDQPRWLYELKRMIKSTIEKSEPNLYDLSEWVVYDTESSSDSGEHHQRRSIKKRLSNSNVETTELIH